MLIKGYPVRRGDIWYADLDPTLGSEIRKTRPVIIVSADVCNRRLPRVQVVPLTSNTSKVYPGETVVTTRKGNQKTKSKALANQLRTIDQRRIRGRMMSLSRAEMQAVEAALRFQLGL